MNKPVERPFNCRLYRGGTLINLHGEAFSQRTKRSLVETVDVCGIEYSSRGAYNTLKMVLVQDDVYTGLILKRFVEGSTASLPCNIDAPISDDTMTLVLWYKDGSESPIYSLDARSNNKKNFPSHFARESLGSRAIFNLKAKNPALLVNPIKKSDEGLYRCRVDFAHSRTINYLVKLVVIVPPIGVVIKSEDNKISNGTIGPYKEGYTTIISCEVTGGDPKPMLSIRINGQIIKDYFLEEEQMKSDGNKGSILLIRKEIMVKNLARKDFDSNVVCEASNNNISLPLSVSSKITLDLEPMSVVIEPKDSPVLNGENAVIFCRSIGAHPPPIFQWYLGSQQLFDGITQSTSEDRNVTTSILDFIPTVADNNAIIKCRTFSPNIKDRPKEDIRNLTVLYLPIVKISSPSHPRNAWVKEADDLELKCLNDANPSASDIRWFYNSESIYELSQKLSADGESTQIVVSQDTLTIKNVTKEQTGQFWCEVENQIGSVASKKMAFEIKYKPRCVPNLNLVHPIGIFETAEVVCQVDSLPPHVTFNWFFKNKHQEFRLGTIQSENTSSIASYTPRVTQDYGELHCSAKNSIGDQNEPCIFRIVRADAPEAVSNCTITNITQSSLIVDCKPGYDGGLVQTFITEVYQKWTHVLKANISSETSPSFEIVGLPSDTNFVVIIYSANIKGRSHALAVTTSTLSKNRGWYKTPSSLAKKDSIKERVREEEEENKQTWRQAKYHRSGTHNFNPIFLSVYNVNRIWSGDHKTYGIDVTNHKFNGRGNVAGKKVDMASIKPVIGILIGSVTAVVVFIIIIIVITRAISTRRLNGNFIHMLKTDHVANKQQDNKYDEHKARDPLLEQQVKPDAAPFNSMYDANANNQRLNNDLKSQDKSIKKKLNYDEDNEKKEDEITYAELCFPPNAESRKIISKESPTEYAKIVVKKKMPETPKDDGQGSAGEGETSSQSSDGHSQESPLICIHIESSV
ncbi:Nephrin [Nymphon striatum]|nr:Nephrin [Nymphon striatum]